jgi:hypothetical protein
VRLYGGSGRSRTSGANSDSAEGSLSRIAHLRSRPVKCEAGYIHVVIMPLPGCDVVVQRFKCVTHAPTIFSSRIHVETDASISLKFASPRCGCYWKARSTLRDYSIVPSSPTKLLENHICPRPPPRPSHKLHQICLLSDQRIQDEDLCYRLHDNRRGSQVRRGCFDSLH